MAREWLAMLEGWSWHVLNWVPTATEYMHNLKATYCGVSKQPAFLIPGLQRLKAHKDDEQVERILCLYNHREFRASVLLALVM